MRSTLLSPRGVADVFQPVNGAAEKLNNSFSWAQNRQDLSSPKAVSPTKQKTTKLSANKKFKVKTEKIDSKQPKEKKVSSNSSTVTKKEKKPKKDTASKITSTIDDSGNVELYKSAIEMVQTRLNEVNEQRGKDIQQYKEQLRKAKLECKKEFEAIYKPLISNHLHDTQNQQDKKTESSKIIQYLREDNAKIRKEMEYYAKEIKKMKLSNDQLESANATARQSYDELEDHVETMKAVNDKLTSNATIFKAALKKMKRDYVTRTRFHQCEVNSTGYYETCLSKIVKDVKDRSRDPIFIEGIYTIVEEGFVQARDGQEKATPNMAGVADLPMSKKVKSDKKVTWSFMVDEEGSGKDPSGFYDDSDSESSDS
jgi:chromosome segregation ATPase